MKTWEMIKKLTENREKRFKNQEGEIFEILADGELHIEGFSCIYIDDEWEEAKEPVSFMEAVESGCKVRVEHPFISSLYELDQFSNHYNYLTQLFEIFGRAWDEGEVREILLEGKWYIED